MGEGNYLPASADQNWTRRFADCKGKTVTLLALLLVSNLWALLRGQMALGIGFGVLGAGLTYYLRHLQRFIGR